jgi:hypothetical protein
MLRLNAAIGHRECLSALTDLVGTKEAAQEEKKHQLK